MIRVRLASAVALVVALTTCAPRPAAAAWSPDPFLGSLLVVGAAGGQYDPRAVSDGAGGMIVAWRDMRSGTRTYAQRVGATGTALWTANGVIASTSAFTQQNVELCSDGAGGAILVWEDSRNSASTEIDLYAQRFDANGNRLWGAAGVIVCNANLDQTEPAITADGAGGAVIAWRDERFGAETYAQRLNASGVAQWAANGVLLSSYSNQSQQAIVSDGAGGAIVAWSGLGPGASVDIVAQRVLAGGTVNWGANGAQVSSVATSETAPVLVSDGLGGAVLAWLDTRAGGGEVDVYADRFNAAGQSVWGSDLAVQTVVGNATNLAIATDGAGGAILAWDDARSGSRIDLYARRVTAAGDAVWAVDGQVLCAISGVNAGAPALLPDGSGGAFVCWNDIRNGVDSDLFAQRVTATGARLYPTNGKPLALAAENQNVPAALVASADLGLLAAWSDNRNDDIYAAKLDRWGEIGDPEPAIVKVRDVLADQGGQLVVEWTPSHLDVAPSPLSGYSIWRRVPSASVALARARSPRPLRVVQPASAVAQYWEFVETSPARGRDGYSAVIPTTTDSMPGSNPRTSILVSAERSDGAYWDSPPDSGYSVDNLAPAAPAPFTGQYAAGSASLHWGPNAEADLAGYRLYRGVPQTFVPSPANLVASLPDTGYTDAAGGPYYYKLTAVDVHGNESPAAALEPAGIVDVPASARVFAFAPAAPQPARAGTPVTLRFTLPHEVQVRLRVYDTQGRLVRSLADGAFPAGPNVLPFDGRGAGGTPLPSGLYFARIEAGEHRATRRLWIVD